MGRYSNATDAELDQLKEVAGKLYAAAFWKTNTLSTKEQVKLWEDLRKTLGYPNDVRDAFGVELMEAEDELFLEHLKKVE